MNWSSINPRTIKTVAVTAISTVAVAVGGGAVYYGVKPIPKENPPPTVNTALPAPEPTVVDLKIKGNRKSKIYHMRGCPNYADLKESTVVWFRTRDEAEAAGYRMARNC